MPEFSVGCIAELNYLRTFPVHVVTFYSFKGGVGRTLALVNIGVELANSGRRVLLVDFDLEAPGIDTFEPLAPGKPQPGVVDYVSDYVADRSPAQFRDYCYQAREIGDDRGELWIMPAGTRDESYATKLSAIDWQELYGQQDGFLFLEDLKHQWEETLKPDYVLIDSRTGHTEVGGICTRQLPDTVVVFFFPNEQNLTGVSNVVDAIRAEKELSRKEINIELVASNVPSLDDEYEILRKMMRKFARRLGSNDSKGRTQISTINRYDSMHLLNQAIFVIERPRSRLSKQYRALLQKIVSHNLDDREAALQKLTRQFPRPGFPERFAATDFMAATTAEDEITVQRILSRYPDDPEILFMAGQLFKARGDLKEAHLCFLKAHDIASTLNDPRATKFRLELLEAQISQGNAAESLCELRRLFDRKLEEDDRRQAIGLLLRIIDKPPDGFLQLPGFSELSAQELDNLAWQTCGSRDWQEFVISLFRQKKEILNVSFGNLILAAIGTKNFELVVSSIDEEPILAGEMEIQTGFNYGMAKWGASHAPDRQIFSKLLEADLETSVPRDCNYEQCLALAAFIAGDGDQALRRVKVARKLAGDLMLAEFSCWSYLRVDERTFLSDLDEIEQFINEAPIQPVFMR